MAKPKDETFKNRHVKHKKDEESQYIFPNTGNNLKKFCTPEEIQNELKPIGKRKEEKD